MNQEYQDCISCDISGIIIIKRILEAKTKELDLSADLELTHKIAAFLEKPCKTTIYGIYFDPLPNNITTIYGIYIDNWNR